MTRKELLGEIIKNNERISELKGYKCDYEAFMKRGFEREHIMQEYICDLEEIDNLNEENELLELILNK